MVKKKQNVPDWSRFDQCCKIRVITHTKNGPIQYRTNFADSEWFRHRAISTPTQYVTPSVQIILCDRTIFIFIVVYWCSWKDETPARPQNNKTIIIICNARAQLDFSIIIIISMYRWMIDYLLLFGLIITGHDLLGGCRVVVHEIV